MKSKNLTKKDISHFRKIKSLPCGLCSLAPPSEAHHIEQGKHYLCIPLCQDCHTGRNGIHCDKVLWKIRKKDEMGVLNETIKKLFYND